MKGRIIAWVLAVVLLLSGCSDPVGRTVTHQDILLTLPADFVDLSGESYAQGADFMYGRNTLVLMGLAEKKEMLQTMSLSEYTACVISGNNRTCTPTACGEGYLFSYEAKIGDTDYTYVTATFEGDENFWIFQFYGPSEDLPENQPEIDIILESVQFKKTS